MTDEEKRKQVAAQCRAVAHMAKALAQVHSDKAIIIDHGPYSPIDFVGKQTAHLMEVLGDTLNGMDAIDPDEDDWMTPVFREAQRLWPDAPRTGQK